MPRLTGTILAFDFGEKRVGVAVGESATRIAHPLATVASPNASARFDAIARLVDEWKPAGFVVGLPTHMDGREDEMTVRARRFARQLEGRFAVPVAFVDERLTTRDAAARLSAAGVRGHDQKPVRDRVAAQAILEAYFEDPDREDDDVG
jgi:putative Holliday junction resolvase